MKIAETTATRRRQIAGDPARTQTGGDGAVQPSTPVMQGALIQRKCACGGGCPRCGATGEHTMQRRPAVGSVSAATTSAVQAQRLPAELQAGLRQHSGMDLSNVRVYRNSSAPAQVDALAYTSGNSIHLAPGHDRHLAHEAWHVVQQRQGRVATGSLRMKGASINTEASLEAEADRMAEQLSPTGELAPRTTDAGPVPLAENSTPTATLQRQVRINGGRTRVREADYRPGGRKQSVGSRVRVAALIGDNVKRVFTSATELESYANGRTDYIGDVTTANAAKYWYRLPRRSLTVLGESHNNPDGNVEDVVIGLNTSRFMYEPFNEYVDVPPFRQSRIGTGTQTRMAQIHSGAGGSIRIGGLVNRRRFNPDLENIVIKALAGVLLTRNDFIAGNPFTMTAARQQRWRGRATTNDYSDGERTALYLSMAMHIAADLAAFRFSAPSPSDSPYLSAARTLADYYTANRAVFDSFMRIKDADDLIGIYELMSPGNFRNLPVIFAFTLVFQIFAARYIEQLGRQTGNRTLRSEGTSLVTNLGATLNTLNPAREEIMWQKIRHARSHGYLIVGMGNTHRTNLAPRLNRAGIAHDEVENSLQTQEADVNSRWVP